MDRTGLLQTQNLSVGYPRGGGSVVLFEHLDLTLPAEKLVCIMGPNGVGKSTLIRTLAGLQPPLSGNILLPLPGRTEENISVVLTDRLQAPNMTAYDVITTGRYPYLNWAITLGREDRRVIDDAMERVHVGHLAEKKIDELSDGQMQLVMIARALTQNTPVMLLDEPTAHLDLSNRVAITNLLRSLSRSTGKAILMTTHDLDLALQTADRIWLATSKKKIINGLPEDMILDGSFEEVFQLKGYDLKTGQLEQPRHHKISIRLTGEEPAYRWTKSALERNGFAVADNAVLGVRIERQQALAWRLSDERLFTSLESLIAELEKNG
jgi:iron complex transport system ATP-binding protein